MLVTSRNALSGLVATEGAQPVDLDLMPAGEAQLLLVHRLGARRVQAEPRAVDEIITRCAGLPLALAIAGARAATHGGFPLAALADQLRDTRGGKVELEVEGRTVSLELANLDRARLVPAF